MGTTIRFFKTEDIEVIAAALTEIGWPDRTSILERYLAEQNAGDRTILVAHSDGNFAGYAATLWKSSYPHFVEQGIPEINDLNVPSRLPATGDIKRPDGRSRETHIREVTSGRYWRGDVSELRLRAAMYILRGYVPDTLGLYYKGQHVKRGQEVCVDDELILYLTKEI